MKGQHPPRKAWRLHTRSGIYLALLAVLGFAACRGTGIQLVPTEPEPPPPPGTTVVLVGAGDIANGSPQAEATAALLDGIPGIVFTTGDNAYPNGTAADYATNYAPTWGRHKARTRPSPGNHDYHTPGAPAYFAYFGSNAGPAGRGYYSYDAGDWHIISLNSEIDMKAGSPQELWLRADLAAHRNDCTLAYWHRPRFSAGDHGSTIATQALWQALHEAGAEIVVVGHDHNYQRFSPMTATGVVDPQRGIREFVVGTGGSGLYQFAAPIANTEAYDDTTHGVLKLTLGPGTYAWKFIPIAGQTYSDSGTGSCHR
ncbi:MAG TPA: metallophosphoesterase [Candidatus Eisenbacteria bacterium]|nr:metallophosphoesterase [Candidatus Eisenbacteria bacterium]